MKYTQFDKKTLKTLRIEIQAALHKCGIEGVEFEVGNMRFSEHEVDIKLRAKVSGTVTKADKELKFMIQMNKWVESRNGYRLVGYKSSNWKYPFLYTHNGKTYKGNEATVKVLFG